MCAYRSSSGNDRRAIFVIDSAKFLALWRANPYVLDLAHGNSTSWRKDYKYKNAEGGFSHGFSDPVPIASVDCWMQKRIIRPKKKFFGIFPWSAEPYEESFPCVGMNGRMTRTIWLLANGCKAFPIESRLPSAQLLYDLAAAPGSKMYTVEELTKEGYENNL